MAILLLFFFFKSLLSIGTVFHLSSEMRIILLSVQSVLTCKRKNIIRVDNIQTESIPLNYFCWDVYSEVNSEICIIRDTYTRQVLFSSRKNIFDRNSCTV